MCAPFGCRELFRGRQLLHRRRCRSFRSWVGKGAERLGLEGRVGAEQFDALLRGELPGGQGRQRGRPTGRGRPHILAEKLVAARAGGRRPADIDAYREAVIETLRWAEKNAAQTRMGSQAGYGKVATITCDWSFPARHQPWEPNLRFTRSWQTSQGSDGKWRALRNDKLWSFNTLLNSMTMARFRWRSRRWATRPGRLESMATSKPGHFPRAVHGPFDAARSPRRGTPAG